ncbi:MAG: hypothetical protein OJF52_001049 [Nitrospira sp.]|nr:MAG: hypothetical protein OJF52_001049 [Nitrospira sp.]
MKRPARSGRQFLRFIPPFESSRILSQREPRLRPDEKTSPA